MAECPNCKVALPGAGAGVAGVDCQTCGFRPERDQPSGVASDGRLRDMVDPGSGQDMGGNPLQEGILGDWQNRGVRDESFASVKKTASHQFSVDLDHPEAMIHNGNSKALKFLDAKINGKSTRENFNEIFMEGHGTRSREPVHVEVPHPEYEQAATTLIQRGSGAMGAKLGPAGEHFLPLLEQIKSGQAPAPPGIELPKQARVSLHGREPHPTHPVPRSTDPRYQISPRKPQPWLPATDAPHLPQGASPEETEEWRKVYKEWLDNDHNPAHEQHEEDYAKNPSMFGVPTEGGYDHPDRHILGWNPGSRGRGLFLNDKLHTWPINPTEENPKGGFMHYEYTDRFKPAESVSSGFEIDPDGSMVGGYDAHDQAAQADPRLKPGAAPAADDFNFANVQPVIGMANWEDERIGDIEMPWAHAPEPIQKEALGPLALVAAGGRALMASPAGKSLIQGAGSKIKGVLPSGLSGAAGGLAKGVGKHMLFQQVAKGLLGTGGGQPQQQLAPGSGPARSYEQLSHVQADLQTPSSVPSIGTGGDPEQVDQREFNDGDNTTNQYDPSASEGGADQGTGDPQVDLFIDALPDILHYYESEESGLQNPKIRQLFEMLEAEEKGHTAAGPSLPPNAMAPAQPPGGIHPVQQPGLQGEAPGQGRCPSCGGVLAANGQCPQCGAAGTPPSGPALGAPGVPQQGIGQLQQTGLQAPVTAAHEHQGPRNSEQFAAVAELLTGQGREGEIVTMLQTPWEYSEEMAQVQQKQAPPLDESEPPEQPAQEEAPPGDTIPMPVPPAPQQLAAALNKVGADNIAPRCPKCDSATTKLLSEDGDCSCHRCGNTWTVENVTKEDVTKDRESKVATPRHFTPEHQDLHVDKDTPVNLPAADQASPDRDEQDTERVWSTPDGEPLRVGDTYEMTSAQYSVPDIVKVNAIKPDGIDLTIVGEYSARGDEDAELSYRHEIPREEAQIERYEFKPLELPEEQAPEHENPGEPTTAPGEVSDLSQHSSLSQSDVNRIASALAEKVAPPAPISEPVPIPESEPQVLNTYEQVTEEVDPERAWLVEGTRLAGAKFTPPQQREFIDEDGTARNSDRLNLQGTHYETRYDAKASPEIVPDDHLVFGL